MVQQGSAVEIFCCYARKDKDLLDELKSHLSPLRRQNVINVWHDGDISAGTEWDQEIKKHLNNAKIILLLISPDFIDSEYCYGTEMKHALEQYKQRGARVIPVLVRPTNGWEKVPPGDIQLGQFQALPKDANPITNWTDHDEAWMEVVEGIERVVKELLIREPVPPQSHFSRRVVMIGLGSLAITVSSGVGHAYITAMSPDHARVGPTATDVATTHDYNTYVSQYGIMFGFDAQHTHNNPYEHTLSLANISHLQQEWVAPTQDVIWSSPVVANGFIYVGSYDGKFYAFDAVTGQQKWVVAMGSSIASSPTVANGLVYIGSGDHKLYAFDAATGQQKWAASTGNKIDSSPTATDGLIYVGSDDHKLYAFNAATGQQKWVASTGNSISCSPALANGLVYVGSADDKLYAFDAATGQQKWVVAANGSTTSSPVVANSLVYIGSWDHKLYAFDASTGQQKWIAHTGGFITSSPAVANSLVYIGSWDGKLYAFDAITGQQKWVAPTGDIVNSPPAVANGLVYVGSDDGKLYIFNAATGQQKWASYPTGGHINSSPAVAYGFVYIGSQDHKLYAFSLSALR